MSETFQIPLSMGTFSPLQLSPSIVSKATPLTASACNSSQVLSPALSSAQLLPSASGTYFQPVMASSYVHQHFSESRFSGATGQSQMSSSVVSCPGIWQWDGRAGSGSTHPPFETFTMTVSDQSMTVVSSSIPVHANSIFPVYPSMSASLVQATPSPCIPNQGHGQYYNQSAVGPLLAADFGGLQPYECVSHTGSETAASQPEIAMVLKEIQHINVLPSTSPDIYYSGSVQANAETSFQVKGTSPEIETYLGCQALSQAGFVSQLPETMDSCSSIRSTQLLEGSPPTELGGISIGTPVQNSTHSLALEPSWEQLDKENWNEMSSKGAEPLDAHKILISTQDPPLLSLALPDTPKLLASVEHPIPAKPGSQEALLGKCHLGLQDQGTPDKGTESSPGWADVAALVKDIQLPQVLHSLDDLDQSYQPTHIEAQGAGTLDENPVQENSAITKGLSPRERKNKHKASEPITGAPEAKIQLKAPESLSEGEGCIFNAAASDRAPTDVAEKSYSKFPVMVSSRTNQDKGRGQVRAKRTKENNDKKALKRKQSGTKDKAEEMPTIPDMRRKRHQPMLGREVFKMPRTCLGMHMLESVQVFHPLGKKLEKKAGSVSSQALRTSSVTKNLKTSSTSKPLLGAHGEGKNPDSTRDNFQNPQGTVETGPSSASLCELPPPGQVKLIPLPFLSPEKPQARPSCRRPRPPVSQQPAVAHQAGPAGDRVQPPLIAAGNTSLVRPIKPAHLVPKNASQPLLTSEVQPGVPPRSAVCKPASWATSPCPALRRVPVATAVTKQCSSPPQPHNPYLLEDFSRQPIPWREPNVPEPVMSNPITEEQRPEREAMKRQAQLERELAAKYTSLGKLQFFRQREKDREIAQYYGYIR
ncbi:uncharacterized protein C2orf78 [Fukomys damarensis]|uniref:DUF4629 domain-containing protein n=1 Tax=Fukomys damarensis TaxID=885580 RepID=A0A091E3W7_FUKDA|nr:uncharacterized protein C2orf78 [Fukomys damarensis]KFO29756.1 hypothetical protein H920_08911 [Fukomys damarensis]